MKLFRFITFLFIFASLVVYTTYDVNAQSSMGDANGDGKVDGIDYTTWLNNYNTNTTQGPMRGDFNNNGVVDGVDYTIWLSHYGEVNIPGAGGANSHAFGIWGPTSTDTCTKADHDSIFVIGPDGKKYPTWHSPTFRRSNGSTCTFGHEHGRNPANYQYWNEIRQHFAFDADGNGNISSAELATSGIPFGYVNEQLDLYFANQTQNTFMRHEDHVGHKIEYANGEGDIGEGTDPFDNSMTGGIEVPVKSNSSGRKWDPSGIRCYHFHKIHQGVSTPDALTNNIHEVIMHTNCSSSRAGYPSSTTLISGMVSFGAPGEFTRFCGGDRNQIIRLGTTNSNANFPGSTGDGQRNIITRDCVESSVLVPPGRFSSFPYEIWGGILRIRNASKTLASNDGGWEVLDAIRYYNPASTNCSSSSPNACISYSATWCTERLGDREARGGACEGVPDSIVWNSPASPFRGIQRGQYINPPRVSNSGGPNYWYSDPMGGNARTTAFPGSIKQLIPTVNASVNFSSDPRIILRRHDTGGNTVHAPN